MNWCSVQASWDELRSRMFGHWGKRSEDDHGRCSAAFCARYGISRDEASREKRDWIKDEGVLDDWNDKRSILDM